LKEKIIFKEYECEEWLANTKAKNGKRRMESEEWKAKNGKRRMESEEWKAKKVSELLLLLLLLLLL
jgi:hypothetical protein